jgi:hypothetical protein
MGMFWQIEVKRTFLNKILQYLLFQYNRYAAC